MKKKTYCAIIGDINKSRSLPQRSRIQKKFQKAIDTVNSEYRASIASRFLITIGDEFQGLLATPAQSYAVVKRFRELMSPVPFSFGIGTGTLSTPLKEETLGMDGRVFYYARSAIGLAKRNRKSIVFRSGSQSDEILNSLTALMDVYWNRLTARQKQIITLFMSLRNQQRVAKKLKISQPAVNKTLTSTGAHEYIRAGEAIQNYLQSLVK